MTSTQHRSDLTSTGSPVTEKPRWRSLLWLVPLAVVGLVAVVLAARAFAASGTGQSFLATYPGRSELPAGAPSEAPWWLQWQHAFNFFLIVLLVRSGWLVHSQLRPEAYWTRNNTGRFRTTKPPTKMSLYLWLHLVLDALWVVNGAIFVVLLLVSDSWQRIVPVDWDIVPNAASAALQYLSLSWPAESPWVGYNALQLLAYFVTVFVAAPLAVATGLRLSPVWRPAWTISRIYPVELARAIHLPVMFYFLVFTVVHVALVLASGMRSNLNYMYAGSGEGGQGWWGFGVFLVSLLVVLVGWVAARPIFMAPLASLAGRVTSR